MTRENELFLSEQQVLQVSSRLPDYDGITEYYREAESDTHNIHRSVDPPPVTSKIIEQIASVSPLAMEYPKNSNPRTRTYRLQWRNDGDSFSGEGSRVHDI